MYAVSQKYIARTGMSHGLPTPLVVPKSSLGQSRVPIASRVPLQPAITALPPPPVIRETQALGLPRRCGKGTLGLGTSPEEPWWEAAFTRERTRSESEARA